MNDGRPDPDQLIERVKAEEASRKRGKLKIFFGACPGVGKTFKMLQQARIRRAEGMDVVIGFVETHGRADTASQLESLEVLPRLAVGHRGTTLQEFDLDGAIRRRPTLLLVDEMAHTNAPGVRHAKRWNDIEEVLDAGINVWTTLNVQHIESLNDVVAKITHVVVQETIPDKAFEQADEVEFVDLPADDLLKRLHEGKVYLPEQAARAKDHFFRKGNLLALRELALRRTAERINIAVRDYRRGEGIGSQWPTRERLLVAVGPSPSSSRLIRATKRMADSMQAPWHAVFVETSRKLSAQDSESAEKHLELARQLGGNATSISGEHVVTALLDFARTHNVTRIVAGKPTHSRWRDLLGGSLMHDLLRGSGDIDVLVITGDVEADSPQKVVSPVEGHRTSSLPLFAVMIVALATATCLVMFPRIPLADLTMVYLLGVVVVALRKGVKDAVIASCVSVVAFNFFFVPPRFTLFVADASYIVTFGTFLVVGILVSVLTHRLHKQMELIRERESRAIALYELTRLLATESELLRVATVAGQKLRSMLGIRILVAVYVEPDTLEVLPLESINALNDSEIAVLRWVLDHGEPAGATTDTLAGAQGWYIPLKGSRGIVGALCVVPEHGSVVLEPGQRQLLGTACDQLALALERLLLSKSAQQAAINVEAERLRNSLLSSVSHDLRTPLASITGAASTLQDKADVLDPESRSTLVATIREEAAYMNRLISNLLDMTRIEAGKIALHREWCSMEELIGAALARVDQQLTGRKINVDVPANLPLVPVDAVFIEQVLINLLENAARHTPQGTPVDIQVLTQAESIIVRIADRGPGILPGEETLLFEKFQRAERAVTRGLGLGLAICKGILTAHGGTIVAYNRDGGGAVFEFKLKVPQQPKINREISE